MSLVGNFPSVLWAAITLLAAAVVFLCAKNRRPLFKTLLQANAIGVVALVALAFGEAHAALPNRVIACTDPPPPPSTAIFQNAAASFCRLCGTGTVTLVVANPYDVDLKNVVVTANLGATGLQYVAGSGNPVPSGPLTWNIGTLRASRNNNITTRTITFDVKRPLGNEEGLVNAVLDITANVSYQFNPPGGTTCPAATQTDSETAPLTLREPRPRMTKTGRNVDAAQTVFRPTIWGHTGDDIIWRVAIQAQGTAPMQDLTISDVMDMAAPPNATLDWACRSANDATTIANNNGVGGAPSCVALTGNQAINLPLGTTGFGLPGASVNTAGVTNFNVYFVGKITASCSNRRNTATSLEWGCELDGPPDGGITRSSTGYVPAPAAATLNTHANTALSVTANYTGINPAQPVGTKGYVTFTLGNNTNGTIRNINLSDVLPPEYVIDPTYWDNTYTKTLLVGAPVVGQSSISTNPDYGAYLGRIDRVTWTNPDPNTLTPGSQAPLNNTTVNLRLWSSTVNTLGTADPADDQRDMLRPGETLTITFPIVLVNSAHFDKVADLDVLVESPATMPLATDPAAPVNVTNSYTVTYEEFCNVGMLQTVNVANDPVATSPEDLDVDVVNNAVPPVFILTNTEPLPLTVSLTNNGGHEARDAHLYVTFGNGMTVQTAPAQCSPITYPPAAPGPLAWTLPAPIPVPATVYDCIPGVVPPNGNVQFNFQVVKANPYPLNDDLTFRADVIGPITLYDGTLLTFPDPAVPPRGDGVLDPANNYSLDGVRARVVGFNLLKSQLGMCSENPPAVAPDTQVQIGEECSYHIRTGGWFGFQTPGFQYIAVQNVKVEDQLPTPPVFGQAYISSTTPVVTGQIMGISFNPPPVAPHQGWFDWTFNPPAQRITQKDEWFDVDTTSRLLNQPVDNRAAPNVHAAISTNELNSYFEAVFSDGVTEQIIPLGPTTLGYPSLPFRSVDLQVIEPNLLVTKEVCNETATGLTGVGCGAWATTATGDTYDSYVYRVTLTNQAAAGGVTRAPAYDVVTTDTVDPSDLMLIVPFDADGLDNDGDGLIDGADPDGEGTITSDNIVLSGAPAIIQNSYTHSSALLRVDPGASVTFYYRVDPDYRAAPQQQLINQISATYDSMAGISGNQTVVPRPTHDVAGARGYTSAIASATVQIIPLQTQPKEIMRLSHTPVGGAPQSVSVGEEIEYRLRASIPVAQLRSFVIRDQLPAGLSCIEAPVVDLSLPPYDVAGFLRPDGTPVPPVTPVCAAGSDVVWNFGDVVLSSRPAGATVFDFPVQFIARVDNSAVTNDGTVLSNGWPATITTLSYVDSALNPVTLNYGQNDVVVTEPQIALTKSFLPVVNGDADDVVTVTVTATNNGTANAYNLRVLDDLTKVNNLIFVGGVGGTDPPDVIDTTTLGPNSPIFIWTQANPSFTIAPGTTRSFTFQVRVDKPAQPLEILDNTVQGSWTSLPDSNTALTTGGTIGIDGAADGMRNGMVPNNIPLPPINDYETSATASISVPPITVVKSDLDALAPIAPAIGAHKHFQIEIRLPEGVSNNVVVTDNLAFSGLSYVLSNNPQFPVTYEFIGINTINGQVPSEAAFTGPVPVDNTANNAIWNIGSVVTQTEDDLLTNAISPAIRINYYARINNDMATNVGGALQNSVVVDYTHGETGLGAQTPAATTPASVVIEPSLLIGKTATAMTPPLTGGGIVEYVVTMQNVGNATAFDVNVVDTLPPGMLLDTTFTPQATLTVPPGGPTTLGTFIPNPAGAPTGPLVWGRNNGDATLDIPAGATLTLTYHVQVQEVFATTYTNTVNVDWTSLDGVSGYERTGAGCPAFTAPNDYCAGATSNIGSTDTTRITKSIFADTFVDPSSTATDGIVRVGDIITYRLALDLREGITRNVVVNDALPVGLALVDYTITPASGSNFAYTVRGAPFPTQTTNLTWDLGNIVNTPDGIATNDTLTIEYRVLVLANYTLPHQPITPLPNTATLSYTDSNGVAIPVDPTRMVSGPVSATVWQPVITTVTKSDRTPRASPAAVNVATDIMRFRLEACNTTGQAPAYNVSLTDTLATQLNETTITGPVNGLGRPDVTINGVAAVDGVDYLYTPPALRGGDMVFRLNTPVNPGQCVTVDYDIGFYTDFGPNQTWDNRVTLGEYWSLPNRSGQRYNAVGPAIFTMGNPAVINLPTKTVTSPLNGEAAIGQLVTYQIQVPGTLPNAALHNVAISDTLDANLELVSATLSGGVLGVVDTSTTSNGTTPAQVSFNVSQIPAGQQATIDVVARVRNVAGAQENTLINNTVSYTYSESPTGPTIIGGSASAPVIKIVEPLVAITKSVNATTANAGDILRYTVTLTASGGVAGDAFANAFDVTLTDNLSLGLAYAGNPTVSGPGNVIGAPTTVTGDGITTAQQLVWSLAGGSNIDIVEGTVVTVAYDVRVLDGVLAGQTLSNSAVAQWTGLDGANAFERDGSGGINDYITLPASAPPITIPDTTTLTKTRLTDTYGAADVNVRVGDIIDFELRLGLSEGTYNNLVLTDILPQGLRFEQVVSINGATTAPYAAQLPFSHPAIAAPTVSGDGTVAPTTVTWNLGNVVNGGDNNPLNDVFVIVYRARVLNNGVLPQLPTTRPLTNNARLDYTTFTGAANQIASASLNLQQPLLAVNKTAAPAGGDTILAAGEVVTYTLDITNSGAAPAYDAVVTDLLPAGMRVGGISVVSMQLVNAGTVLPNLAPAYVAATGQATWNFDTGVADAYTIPAGDTLRIVYRAQADADVGAGLSLPNSAQVALYYSFDNQAVPVVGGVTGARQIYGPSNTAVVTLTTPLPGQLLKANTQATAAVGEPFSYLITVPATPVTTALHDVRILDDLRLSRADLSFVSVTKVAGTQPWTPVNTGTAKNLVIEDPTNGIDIPAGQQVVVRVTVVLNDSPTNVSGLQFNNTASYTYNQFNGEPLTRAPETLPYIAPNMTIVGPDSVTLQKSGPVQMRVGTPGTFTLDVQNAGTGTAWDLTITDMLPNQPGASMCATPPTVTSAQIFLADGVTPVSPALVAGTDFVTSFAPAPSCTLTLTMQSAAAAIDPNNRLIITYQASLNADNLGGAVMTNVAGATQWFSADTAGAGATGQIRTYTRTFSATDPGTPLVLDHEDAHTVTGESPLLTFEKTVFNVTTGQASVNGALSATPGDRLKYSLVVNNVGTLAMTNFTLSDELDRLNASPMFAAGTLTLITVPTGATANNNPNGGANGTGLAEIQGLTLNPGASLLVEFEVNLAASIANGTVVVNQGQLLALMVTPPLSDEPSLAGTADPTPVTITSAPAFRVLKSSTDLTPDTAVLMAGDILRYTITVKNVGTEDATGATLTDQIPPNTTYVANSTRLNGVVVPDPAGGGSPLQAGMLINAPENGTPGAMRADATATTANVATVTFDVRIDPNAVNGTLIANQGFVAGAGVGSGPMADTPSDDPATATPADPTVDVVGNVPLVDAQKTVAIAVDNGTPGVVDPGDVLRYTITVTNQGGAVATGVVLTDAVPANTTYVADSVTLNGLPVGQPDGGVSPLAAGIAVSSSDRTPPLPSGANGILSAGGAATVTFDVTVNGVAGGTLIRNQGFVATNEQPTEPTDADGIDANGDQPTDVIVGNTLSLIITKQVAVIGGNGTAAPGGILEYTVRVTNPSSAAVTPVVITDDLTALPVTPVAGSETLNGLPVGVTWAGMVLTADYSATYGPLAPGATAVVRFRVQIDPAFTVGRITNTAQVAWDTPTRTATATVSIDIGGAPGSAMLSGRVWHDGNLDRVANNGESNMANWSVEIYRNGLLFDTKATDSNGQFRATGLPPDQYVLRFHAPGAGPNTAALGWGDSAFTSGMQQISAIDAISGANLLDLNLPLQPNGVVYDALSRAPVAGATVTMVSVSTGNAVPASCLHDPAQQNQVTGAGGHYKFDLSFAPTCPPPGDYLIQVTPPSAYEPGPSRIIPPMSGDGTAPFSVPTCPGSANDAVPATANLCEIQASESAPAMAVLARTPGTNYYLKLTVENAVAPRDSQPFNNHIALDPKLDNAVAITKTASLVNATRGQIVPYTITVKNTMAVTLQELDIVDTMPPGFKYVERSARFDKKAVEPAREGRRLIWTSPDLATDVQHTITLLLVVGSGVSEGDYVNRAQIFSRRTGTFASGEAQATVRVVPDPDFDCTDITGKVFDDVNVNGRQDEGEAGLAGVRIVSARGLIMTTDEHGRYHLTCAVVPDEDRGSNFILKLDDRSLPSGYRVVTENPLVQRTTRGKMIKFNFGAAIHRVVTLTIADGVFEPDSAEMRIQWKPRLDTLVEELSKSHSVLRLSYMGDVEKGSLVNRRIKAVKETIAEKWQELDCCGPLSVETEIFWRRGGPP